MSSIAWEGDDLSILGVVKAIEATAGISLMVLVSVLVVELGFDGGNE